MTVENCIKLLEAYKKQAENPVDTDGTPYTGDKRKHAISQSKKNYEEMKKHILNSRKFKDHPILSELKEKVEKPKVKLKEVKEDGKKPKG